MLHTFYNLLSHVHPPFFLSIFSSPFLLYLSPCALHDISRRLSLYAGKMQNVCNILVVTWKHIYDASCILTRRMHVISNGGKCWQRRSWCSRNIWPENSKSLARESTLITHSGDCLTSTWSVFKLSLVGSHEYLSLSLSSSISISCLNSGPNILCAIKYRTFQARYHNSSIC